MQVYQGFDIGTDKIPPDRREGIPHHLIDVVAPGRQFNAADFARAAAAAVKEIRRRKHIPVITGGTGLYLKALFKGLFPEGKKNMSLRKALEKETETKGLENQWKTLLSIDPVYAEKIGPKDRIRIIRALEVYYTTHRPLTGHFAKTRPFLKGFDVLKIGLERDRKALYTRIEKRVDEMFERGLVQETRRHLASGLTTEAPPFRALGYRHVVAFLQKKMSLEEAVSLTKRDTRHYAKRQITWFSKMEGISWFRADAVDDILAFIRERLIKENNGKCHSGSPGHE